MNRNIIPWILLLISYLVLRVSFQSKSLKISIVALLIAIAAYFVQRKNER